MQIMPGQKHKSQEKKGERKLTKPRNKKKNRAEKSENGTKNVSVDGENDDMIRQRNRDNSSNQSERSEEDSMRQNSQSERPSGGDTEQKCKEDDGSSYNQPDNGRESDQNKNEDSGSPRKQNKKPKRIQRRIEKTLQNQLQSYVNEYRRLTGFRADGKRDDRIPSAVDPELPQINKLCIKVRPNQMSQVGRGEAKRLSRFAQSTLDSVDVYRVWCFHEFDTEKSDRRGIPNYSRHFGNILNGPKYQSYYSTMMANKRQ